MRQARGFPSTWCHAYSAAPSAFPASPAAGWMNMCSNGVSWSSRAFITEFSATPPASARFLEPVRSCSARTMCSPASSVTACNAKARSSWCSVSSDSATRGGPYFCRNRSLSQCFGSGFWW